MPSNPDYNEYAAYYPGGSAPLTQNWNLYPGGSAPPGVENRHTVQAGARALNLGGLLALGQTAPEANPRQAGTGLTARLFRELGQVRGRVSSLEQKV